ncbi:hypothetical protein K490DRAFT_66059 [Saccharata proteae CBS 121410]|uniref:Casein kinase substrate phosphoprotein PP28 domain-containing protein n=1 Tax=Saccharata proteae CBS 121410 TaxID=1314787 RepID=A0A9P4LV66_9PEZI|nr:hypothetical protein K490DRAFT_66059 [Saccharata proteae CBS 121410]
MSTRGRAGKFTKPKRGGGKHFSRNLQPLNDEGEVMGMWGEPRDKKDESSSEEDSSEGEEDDSSDEEGGQGDKPDMTREERRAAAKARKEAAIARQKAKATAPGDLPPSDSEEESDDEPAAGMPANPNHTTKAAKQAAGTVKGPSKDTPVSQLSRREREALQAQQARERYQKMHAEGKTDEARADLARLKLVREKREAESARKKAEAEEKAEHEKEKREQLARMERQAELKRNKKGNKKK